MEYNATNPLPSLLKHFRKKAGLTQTDVATALSMSRSGYANYEEGRNIPNIEQTLQLSELLHHDLLYAYTLSSRYMRARSNRSRQMVMESDTYLAAIKTNENMAALMTNYQKCWWTNLLKVSQPKQINRLTSHQTTNRHNYQTPHRMSVSEKTTLLKRRIKMESKRKRESSGIGKPDKTNISEISKILNSSLSDNNDKNTSIASAFRSMRTGRGLTQAEMAAFLEISTPAYSHYERGDRIPDMVNLIKVSNLFCINISYLLLLSCIDAARKNGYSTSDVFRAYGHGQTLPEEEAEILSSCSKLSPENRENLRIFLKSAVSIS